MPGVATTCAEVTGVMARGGVWGASPSGVRGGAPRRNFGLEWRVLNENRTGLAGPRVKKTAQNDARRAARRKASLVLSLLTVLLGLCRCFVAARLLRVAVR